MLADSVVVVLASYNGARYISEQLDSLLSQTYPCTIVIVDDDSTDGTVELLQEHYLHHNQITLVPNTQRLGYVKNFEKGIIHAFQAGAQMIALCDQDDVWEPTRLEQGVNALNNHENDGQPLLIYSDLAMMNSTGVQTHASYMQYRGYTPSRLNQMSGLAMALGQNGVMGNTVLMNRALVELILPFPDGLHVHDYWISLIAQLYGRRIFVPQALVNYRIHEDNSSNSTKVLGAFAHKKSQPFWRKLIQRDYRLPYKEDSRGEVLQKVLAGYDLYKSSEGGATDKRRLQRLSSQDRSLIEGFLHYLNVSKPRWYLAYWMMRQGFIRKGWEYKLRFIYRLLMTKRYD